MELAVKSCILFVYKKSIHNTTDRYSFLTGDMHHANDDIPDSFPVVDPYDDPHTPGCTTLTLTVAMYDIMVSGLKSVEYRPNTPYYRNRLYDSHGRLKIEMIKFGKAYLKNRPSFYRSIDYITIVHEVDQWYGNVHVMFPYSSHGYFAIHFVQ